MKKTVLRSIIVLQLLLFALYAKAYDFKYGNFCYTITSIPKKTVEVAKSNINYTGKVIIPSKVRYKDREWTVTGIGSYAFMNRTGITELILPPTLKYIDSACLTGCVNLKYLKLPDGVILKGAALMGAGMQFIEIPRNTKFYGNLQLEDMRNLQTVSIEEGVDSIFNYVFQHDRLLTKVIMPNTLKYLGFGVFDDCRSLRTIKIPASVTKIESPLLDSNCGVTSIYVQWQEPIEIDDKTFPNGKYLDATLYVPKGTKEIYQSTNGWSNFLKIIEY